MGPLMPSSETCLDRLLVFVDPVAINQMLETVPLCYIFAPMLLCLLL